MLTVAITYSGAKFRRTVDYVTEFLVNDNFDILGRITNHFCVAEIEQTSLLAERDIARRYLK